MTTPRISGRSAVLDRAAAGRARGRWRAAARSPGDISSRPVAP